MRLIDALELKCSIVASAVVEDGKHIFDIIDDQPTIEERKTGRWIYHVDDVFPAESTQECNQCHAEQPLTCDDNYCPNCGARMEADQ